MYFLAVGEEIKVLLVDGALLVLNDVPELHDTFGRGLPLHLLPAFSCFFPLFRNHGLLTAAPTSNQSLSSQYTLPFHHLMDFNTHCFICNPMLLHPGHHFPRCLPHFLKITRPPR